MTKENLVNDKLTKQTLDVEFVQGYLDAGINMWVSVWKNGMSTEEKEKAAHYVDAFQNVRQTLLGQKLPINV